MRIRIRGKEKRHKENPNLKQFITRDLKYYDNGWVLFCPNPHEVQHERLIRINAQNPEYDGIIQFRVPYGTAQHLSNGRFLLDYNVTSHIVANNQKTHTVLQSFAENEDFIQEVVAYCCVMNYLPNVKAYNSSVAEAVDESLREMTSNNRNGRRPIILTKLPIDNYRNIDTMETMLYPACNMFDFCTLFAKTNYVLYLTPRNVTFQSASLGSDPMHSYAYTFRSYDNASDSVTTTLTRDNCTGIGQRIAAAMCSDINMERSEVDLTASAAGRNQRRLKVFEGHIVSLAGRYMGRIRIRVNQEHTSFGRAVNPTSMKSLFVRIMPELSRLTGNTIHEDNLSVLYYPISASMADFITTMRLLVPDQYVSNFTYEYLQRNVSRMSVERLFRCMNIANVTAMDNASEIVGYYRQVQATYSNELYPTVGTYMRGLMMAPLASLLNERARNGWLNEGRPMFASPADRFFDSERFNSARRTDRSVPYDLSFGFEV